MLVKVKEIINTGMVMLKLRVFPDLSASRSVKNS